MNRVAESNRGQNLSSFRIVGRMRSYTFQFIPCVRGLDQLFALAACRPFAIADQVPAARHAPVSDNVKIYHEKWLATSDGTVVGIVDYLCDAPEGATLRDYKTGLIWEIGTSGNSAFRI
jgi:hypothetical protein